jgi:YD repeat-containing protein
MTNSFAYDLAGRRSAFTNGLGAVTVYAFDPVGNVTSVTAVAASPLPLTTFSAYDSMNRLTVNTLPDTRASTNAYNALGQMIARTGAGSVPAGYEFDAAGKMTKLIDGEANETAFFWRFRDLLVKSDWSG